MLCGYSWVRPLVGEYLRQIVWVPVFEVAAGPAVAQHLVGRARARVDLKPAIERDRGRAAHSLAQSIHCRNPILPKELVACAQLVSVPKTDAGVPRQVLILHLTLRL